MYVQFTSCFYGDRQLELKLIKHCETLCIKIVGFRTFSGLYSPIFGLNMEIYQVYIRNQYEDRSKQTRKKFVFGYFSFSDVLLNKLCEIRISQKSADLPFHPLSFFTYHFLSDQVKFLYGYITKVFEILVLID